MNLPPETKGDISKKGSELEEHLFKVQNLPSKNLKRKRRKNKAIVSADERGITRNSWNITKLTYHGNQ